MGSKPRPLLAAVVALLVACGSAPQAHFTGSAFPRAVADESLIQRRDIPHDHDAIGTVDATCARGAECSEFELLRSMREAASDAGGTAFIAAQCSQSDDGTRLTCTATVARDRSLSPMPSAAETDTAKERRWQEVVGGRTVRVTVRPRGGTFESVPLKDVKRVWTVEEPARLVGTVRAECMEVCDRSDADRGLDRGAAWMGAKGIASVRCYETRAGHWTCEGDLVDTRRTGR